MRLRPCICGVLVVSFLYFLSLVVLFYPPRLFFFDVFDCYTSYFLIRRVEVPLKSLSPSLHSPLSSSASALPCFVKARACSRGLICIGFWYFHSGRMSFFPASFYSFPASCSSFLLFHFLVSCDILPRCCVLFLYTFPFGCMPPLGVGCIFFALGLCSSLRLFFVLLVFFVFLSG